jgi:hypothetical protein
VKNWLEIVPRRHSGKRRSASAGRVGTAPRRPRAHRPRFARPWRPQDPGPYATGRPVAGPCPCSLARERRRSRRSPIRADPASKPSLPRPHAELASFLENFLTRKCWFVYPHAHLKRMTIKRMTINGVKLGARAARNASTGRTEALREQSERMPADVRVHHGRARRVRRWTFPEGRSWRKPAEAERRFPECRLSLRPVARLLKTAANEAG